MICLPQTLAAPQASGKDCISLIVSVPNRPGAVHDILVPLKTARRVHDAFRIAPGALGPVGVLFLHRPAGPPVAAARGAALEDLQGLCAFYKVLGTYPVGD